MNEKDKQETIKRYNERFIQFGYSEEALGWSRNKNIDRFAHLIVEWGSELPGASIADFGCGFGDFYGFLTTKMDEHSFQYTGIDINESLIEEGRKRYQNANFWLGDICRDTINKTFDFVFSSGVFNHQLSAMDEYDFIKENMEAINGLSIKGFAVNFLSNKVEYKREHTFHADPGKILDLCYAFSNNVVLRNDCMPYEYTVYVRKDKQIDPDKITYC